MLKVGIVGLPNVGKSTLFNALMRREIAAIGEHPFTTVTPNKGIISVPDKRLQALTKIFGDSALSRPAKIEFVDIAGLVKGAADGAGLGNQFLSHIREVDLILHVLRQFDSTAVAHVAGRIDPLNDLTTIDLELVLADYELVSKLLKEKRKTAQVDKKATRELAVLNKIFPFLEKGQDAISAGLEEEELRLVVGYNLLTLKPVIFVLNISEKLLDTKGKKNLKTPKGIVIPVCIKLAVDMSVLDTKEKQEYLKAYGMKDSGLGRIIKTAYDTLDLISFYTIKGGKIISAWPLRQGSSALDAAAKVHTDFAKRFIKAEVIACKFLVKLGSWQLAREKGLLRTEGKDYKIQDGEVIEFKLS